MQCIKTLLEAILQNGKKSMGDQLDSHDAGKSTLLERYDVYYGE